MILFKIKNMSNTIDKYTQIYWSPFLTWVFIGVNAIKDSALYVDWPDCVFYKSDLLYKTHDINSKLKDPSVDTKLYFSWVMPNKMVRWYDEKIKKKLTFIEENPKFNLWVVTCMPVTWLLATQYNNIYSDFKKNFIFIPSSTDKFYLDWYNVFLKELAKNMSFDSNKSKLKNHISIIWFLFDRNEGDVIWNIEEIKRILSLIWVEIDCIWLDGNNYEDLKKVEESELLISLPYWKLAAKILSKKLSIDFLETNIPFWLYWTIQFLESIGEKLWLNKNLIKEVISKELYFVKEKTDLLDERIFLNKKYLYAWDQYLEKWLKDICNYIWLNHVKSYHYNWTENLKIENLVDLEIDIIIRNSEFKVPLGNYIYFELWFPSYNTHFLLNSPYMWFRWVLFFIQRLYNELSKDNLH